MSCNNIIILRILVDCLVTMDVISDVVEGGDVLVCSPGSILQCPLEVTLQVSNSTKTG